MSWLTGVFLRCYGASSRCRASVTAASSSASDARWTRPFRPVIIRWRVMASRVASRVKAAIAGPRCAFRDDQREVIAVADQADVGRIEAFQHQRVDGAEIAAVDLRDRIVAIAAGGQARIVTGALEQGQTMTGFIANAALGDSRVGTIEYNTLFAVGLLLFTITLLINFISIRFVPRFREAY